MINGVASRIRGQENGVVTSLESYAARLSILLNDVLNASTYRDNDANSRRDRQGQRLSVAAMVSLPAWLLYEILDFLYLLAAPSRSDGRDALLCIT